MTCRTNHNGPMICSSTALFRRREPFGGALTFGFPRYQAEPSALQVTNDNTDMPRDTAPWSPRFGTCLIAMQIWVKENQERRHETANAGLGETVIPVLLCATGFQAMGIDAMSSANQNERLSPQDPRAGGSATASIKTSITRASPYHPAHHILSSTQIRLSQLTGPFRLRSQLIPYTSHRLDATLSVFDICDNTIWSKFMELT
ncbi:hypothetical protein SODALDRAFT_363473 [Sodiomyces alkalinus F11]|uniref:Uncharacterized protein n=1 Tax=Sodiomyces alkalinus (strain CBS 110278 / VKM F-3762 / F11) TaxID=1314773 RepID=A0A3N2PMC2_SODAK|nr:hypothetical protein SODALDRAFT_363473 [Sodiomyces alkalinus F11]ROT35619.1 hypothetical protein SODALDRAFT_363473 [Sodiomyces alkalinus F11]